MNEIVIFSAGYLVSATIWPLMYKAGEWDGK